MELQQRVSVCVNEYEESEEMPKSDAVKTEDIYQCLQDPPTGVQFNKNTLISERSWRKYGFLLFAGNILILTIILVIVGMSYSLHKEIHQIQVANGQKAKNKETWLLHDNVFYLFWNDHSNCNTAIGFCAKRNASLVTLTLKNKVWLQVRANGKQFLVLKDSTDGSADCISEKCYVSDDEDEEQCDIMTPDMDHPSEGFICERKVHT